MIKRAGAQAAFLSRWATTGNCLDVGCGIGALVAKLASQGWNARGIDSDLAAIDFGRRLFGANLSAVSLDQSASDEGSLDLVCLSHVVEHMIDVRHSLTSVARTLKLGGLMFVEVPNQTSPPEGDMESHINFFSRNSLARLMESVGLEVVGCECCGPTAHAAVPAKRSLGTRLMGVSKRAFQWCTGTTDWDGWYDRYFSGDEGIWIRCAGIRRS
jgi:2-polyprenyl-3-methyl-5-hydroxy-6-metoxy-1,4-benzoquinol methylase